MSRWRRPQSPGSRPGVLPTAPPTAVHARACTAAVSSAELSGHPGCVGAGGAHHGCVTGSALCARAQKPDATGKLRSRELGCGRLAPGPNHKEYLACGCGGRARGVADLSTSGLVRPWGAHILVPVGTRLEMGLPGQLMLRVLGWGGGRLVRRGGSCSILILFARMPIVVGLGQVGLSPVVPSLPGCNYAPPPPNPGALTSVRVSLPPPS